MDMPYLKAISTPLLAATLITVSAAAAQDGEDCDLNILDPFNPKWVEQYGVACNNARRVSTTPPAGLDPENGIPFERLKTMPVAGQGPITFTAKTYDANGNLIPKTVTLPDPVIIVSWVFTTDVPPSTVCGRPWQSFKMLQEYVANDCDGALNSWFTMNCDAIEYIDDVKNIDRACLNMNAGGQGCDDTIAIGLPTVGVPFAFGQMQDSKGAYDPYFDAASDYDFAWWEEFVIVAVADRSSLIRPSLNPTVAPNTKDRITDNGEPVWDVVNQRYRRPNKTDAIYPAVKEKLENFVGWFGDDEFRGFNGYWEWQALWQERSWNGTPATPNPPYNQFPYSGLGLTLDWTTNYDAETDTVWAPNESDPLPRDFYALSEFIHIGQTPIYFIGGFEGSQYFGSPEGNQVHWYDSCEADLNMDGQVDGADLSILLDNWDTEEPTSENPTNLCVNIGKISPRVGGAALVELLNNWGDCTSWPFSHDELSPACP